LRCGATGYTLPTVPVPRHGLLLTLVAFGAALPRLLDEQLDRLSAG
jgi:hypothetical protein